MKKKPSPVTRLLHATKRLLVTRGWVKYRAYRHDRTGRPVAYCLSAALTEAALRRHVPRVTRRAAEECLRDTINADRESVDRISLVTYNDTKARRKVHVLKMLDDAIKQAVQRHA